MAFETVKGCGKLVITFNKDDTEGARVSTDLIQKLIGNVIRRCTNYYDSTGDHAFYYDEKQLNSVVCPAIADISSGYLMEYSVERKPRGKEAYRGRADYWIAYRNYAFLMELKHEFCAYNHVNPPRATIFDSFDQACDQLSAIRKEECRLCASGTNNLIKIAFETIVFYGGSKNRRKRDSWREKNFEHVFREMLENSGLKQIANALALWTLNERLVQPYDFDSPRGYFEVYPAVAFVAHISECQT